MLKLHQMWDTKKLSHVVLSLNAYQTQPTGAFGTEMGQNRTGQDKLLYIVFGRSRTELLTVLLCVWYGWDRTGQEV